MISAKDAKKGRRFGYPDNPKQTWIVTGTCDDGRIQWMAEWSGACGTGGCTGPDIEWMDESHPPATLKSAVKSGAFCTGSCGEYYPYAEPADPAKFKCFGCKC